MGFPFLSAAPLTNWRQQHHFKKKLFFFFFSAFPAPLSANPEQHSGRAQLHHHLPHAHQPGLALLPPAAGMRRRKKTLTVMSVDTDDERERDSECKRMNLLFFFPSPSCFATFFNRLSSHSHPPHPLSHIPKKIAILPLLLHYVRSYKVIHLSPPPPPTPTSTPTQFN